jgi:diadenosine tetraphosphate (Ap4A) HIT family hydrolase
MSIQQQVENARAGDEPALVCRVPSGWVVLCQMQFLSGYCVLLSDPLVGSLNELNSEQRSIYLADMARVGDALLEVTGAYRINYGIMGNSDPLLHAHIVPRYLSEPEELRRGLPWSYDPSLQNTLLFDLQRDQPLMQRLAAAIQKRL